MTWLYESDVGWARDLAVTALWQVSMLELLRSELEKLKGHDEVARIAELRKLTQEAP